MTKRDVEIQALLLRHRANGCVTALSSWRYSTNTEAAKVAIPALEARYQTLEAEAAGLDALVEQWDEFGPHFEKGPSHE
jgi:hypothetical protein